MLMIRNSLFPCTGIVMELPLAKVNITSYPVISPFVGCSGSSQTTSQNALTLTSGPGTGRAQFKSNVLNGSVLLLYVLLFLERDRKTYLFHVFWYTPLPSCSDSYQDPGHSLHYVHSLEYSMKCRVSDQ